MSAMLGFLKLFLLLAICISGSQGVRSFTSIHKWFKVACIAEHLKETDHYICDKHGLIHCLPGWSNEKLSCTIPICEPKCVYGQGNCTKPNTCTCEVGWTGSDCSKCVCLPGCVHGDCTLPFDCTCEPGYQGMLCDKPVCKQGCLHGHCTVPGECICHPGWEGENCDQCMKLPGCSKYGFCNKPMECKCRPGWQGNFCHKPICTKGCHQQYGFCSKPNECWCRPGWSGQNCTECVKYPGCLNGVCEGPWECKCLPGWRGKLCNHEGLETTTIYGFKPFHSDLLTVQGNPANLFDNFAPKFKRDDEEVEIPAEAVEDSGIVPPNFEEVLADFTSALQEEPVTEEIEPQTVTEPSEFTEPLVVVEDENEDQVAQ